VPAAQVAQVASEVAVHGTPGTVPSEQLEQSAQGATPDADQVEPATQAGAAMHDCEADAQM